jgi:sugar phosphate isomerase/epimerase
MTTRRNFITQAGVLSAAALLAPQFLQAAKPTKKIGIQLYSMRELLPKDVKNVIKRIGQIGYREVETYGFSKETGYWGLTPKQFKSLLTSHGLSTPSGHYGLDSIFSDNNYEDLKTFTGVAQTLGQKYITVPYLNEKVRKSPDDFKQIAERLNKAAEIVKSSGLKLAYHNHDFEYLNIGGTTLFDTILQETDPKLVDLELDLYWVVRAGEDPISYLNKYPGRITMVHVKDMDIKDIKLNTEVGNGSISYPRIIEKCKKMGVKHFIMEQENFAIDPYASITKSYKYMKDVLHL